MIEVKKTYKPKLTADTAETLNLHMDALIDSHGESGTRKKLVDVILKLVKESFDAGLKEGSPND